MPPSVARPQLPNGNAHATKEPLGKAGLSVFSGGCCTNNTQQWSGLRSNPLFNLKIFKQLDLAADYGTGTGCRSFPLRTRRAWRIARIDFANPSRRTRAVGAINTIIRLGHAPRRPATTLYIRPPPPPYPARHLRFRRVPESARSPLFSGTK